MATTKTKSGWLNKSKTRYRFGNGKDYYGEVKILSEEDRANLKAKFGPDSKEGKAKFSVQLFNDDTVEETKEDIIAYIAREAGEGYNALVEFKTKLEYED